MSRRVKGARGRVPLRVEHPEPGSVRYTRWVPNSEGKDRLVRTSCALGRFPVADSASGATRKPMHFWGVCDIVANAVLAAIAEGADPRAVDMLRLRADGKLKGRCGSHFFCTEVRWVQEALAYSARVAIGRPGAKSSANPEAAWRMLLWDAERTAQDFAQHVLPAYAPRPLLADGYEVDMRNYAPALRIHRMSAFAAREVPLEEGDFQRRLELSATLYEGELYARRVTTTVPIYYT